MKITKAEISDLEMILGIQQISYLDEAKRSNDSQFPPLSQTLESIQNEFTSHIFLKAIIDDMIVGSVRAIKIKDNCYVGRLIVLPRYQGKGIGSALLKDIETYYPDTKRFELFTGNQSETKLHFYKKHGYREFKLEPFNDSITFVYMEKLINKQ